MRTRFAAIMALLAPVLAACGASSHHHKPPDPAPAQSITNTMASPAPTGPLTTGPGVQPGEKPPILSTDAKHHTPAGALAFAAYYFRAYDWGIATTDPYLVEQISASSCIACRSYIAELKALRNKGGHVERGRTTVLSSKLVTGSFKTKSDYVIDFKIKEDAVVLVTPSAPPSTSAPASTYTSLVFVSWRGAGWRIVEEGAP